MKQLLSWLLSRFNKEIRSYRRTLRKISEYDLDGHDPLAASALRQWAEESLIYRGRIFSGDYSRVMWEMINAAKSKRDLREALYLVCCRMQELESKLSQG